MQKRERILFLITIAVVVGWFVIPWAYATFTRPVEERERRLAEMQKRFAELREDEIRLATATRLVEDARGRSLPPRPHDAQRLYHDWLFDLVEMAGFDKPDLNLLTTKPQGKVFTSVPVQIKGNATLDQLGRFLYYFHRADLPHRIEQIDLESSGTMPDSGLIVRLTAAGLAFHDVPDRPHLFPRTELAADLKADDKLLVVTSAEGFPAKPDFRIRIDREYLMVTAIEGTRWTVVRGVDQTRPLQHKKGDVKSFVELAPVHPEFADTSPADYYIKLAGNSPFAKPQRKPPVSPPANPQRSRPEPRARGTPVRQETPAVRPQEIDRTAEFTYFGAYLQHNDRPQVRFYNRQNGQVTVLGESERFKIGTIEGEIATIEHDHVTIRNSGGIFRLPLGETLVYMEKIADPPRSAVAGSRAQPAVAPKPAPATETPPAGPPEPPAIPVEIVDSPESAGADGEPVKAEAPTGVEPLNSAAAAPVNEDATAEPGEAVESGAAAPVVAGEFELPADLDSEDALPADVDSEEPPVAAVAPEAPDAR